MCSKNVDKICIFIDLTRDKNPFEERGILGLKNTDCVLIRISTYTG